MLYSKFKKENSIFFYHFLLFMAIIYLPISIALSQQDEFILLYPTEIRFEPDASKWFFDIMIVSNNPSLKSLKISNAKLLSRDILKALKGKNLKSDNSLPINVYKNIDLSQIKTLQTNLKELNKLPPTYSQLGISVLPGAEVTVFDVSTLENAKGDLLVYGISNLNGIHQYNAEQHNSLNNYKQYRLYPQRAIDVVNVNSSYSSCAIAHPFGLKPSWDDWTVSNYQGFEIFSTWIQSNFTPSSRPLSKWVEELSRLKSSIFSSNILPSVRAGDDWHAKEDLLFRPNYITWIGTKNWNNKNSVDIALRKGKTVVSRKGSLVYFTVNHNSTSYSISDIVKNIPTNASLNIKVVLKPIEKGIYYVGVYEDSFNNIIWWTENECNAGNTYTYSTNFNFKGGKHCYYVYVLGRPINSSYYEEFVYTTPIFISN